MSTEVEEYEVEEYKVGGQAVVCLSSGAGNRYELGNVEKITKTRITVSMENGRHRIQFSRQTGIAVGDGRSWWPTTCHPASGNYLDLVKSTTEAIEKRRLSLKLQAFAWGDLLSKEQLQQVLDVAESLAQVNQAAKANHAMTRDRI